MSEQELNLFIKKVQQLSELVDSLDKVPERRELLSNCNDHYQVVKLAESWGYNIGRRWGEDRPEKHQPQKK